MYQRLRRTLTLIAIATCSALTGSAVSNVAHADTAYGVQLRMSQDEIADHLYAIGWPTADTGNHNFYPGALGHPDNGSTLTWGLPGKPTSYHAEVKCATFLTLSLKHSYAWATDGYFAASFQSTSPSASKYHDAFVAGTAQHFDSVAHVQDLQAGDVMAIKYLDGGSGGPTGHVATVESIQLYNRDGNTSTIEYAVRVVDSTSNPHGVVSSNASSVYRSFPDTRATLSPSTEYTGVGKGYLFIQTDAAGSPAGYWWGPNENVVSGFHSIARRPIALARLTELP